MKPFKALGLSLLSAGTFLSISGAPVKADPAPDVAKAVVSVNDACNELQSYKTNGVPVGTVVSTLTRAGTMCKGAYLADVVTKCAVANNNPKSAATCVENHASAIAGHTISVAKADANSAAATATKVANQVTSTYNQVAKKASSAWKSVSSTVSSWF